MLLTKRKMMQTTTLSNKSAMLTSVPTIKIWLKAIQKESTLKDPLKEISTPEGQSCRVLSLPKRRKPLNIKSKLTN